jgi:hypothetical protein
MSSGLGMSGLNVAAAFVLRSLFDHPDRQTPEEIAGAPDARGRIDAEGARGGLGELTKHGLAAEGSDGCWQLTDAGRKAQQPG